MTFCENFLAAVPSLNMQIKKYNSESEGKGLIDSVYYPVPLVSMIINRNLQKRWFFQTKKHLLQGCVYKTCCLLLRTLLS